MNMKFRVPFIALALAVAIGISVLPRLSNAVEGSDDAMEAALAVAASADTSTAAAVTAQESVVISPSDKPLERKAKLERNWVLYNDGTTVWALYKGAGQIVCVTTPCPTNVETFIKKRAVQTMSFFTAFKANFRIITVNPDRLARFTVGDPITSTDGLTADMFVKRPYLAYRLVKAQGSPAVYLDDGEKLRPIVHEKVFKNLGLDFKDVETIAANLLGQKPVGTVVTADTVFTEPVEVQTTEARKTVEDVKSRLGETMMKQVKNAIIKAGEQYFMLTKQGKRLIAPAQQEQISQRLKLDLSKAVEVTTEEAAVIPTMATVTAVTPAAEVSVSAQ